MSLLDADLAKIPTELISIAERLFNLLPQVSSIEKYVDTPKGVPETRVKVPVPETPKQAV